MGVDVVIVNWNGGRELVAAVESVLRFGGRPIVVDNASADTTALREVEQATGVTVIRNARNTGFSAGCNTGAAAGHNACVLLLNPDAEIIQGTAADLELAFAQSTAMVIGPRLEGVGGELLATVRPLPRGIDLVADLLRVQSVRDRMFGRPRSVVAHPGTQSTGWMVGAALAVRRADWERLGGMDEGFFLWYEDVDFGARVARAGGAIAIIDMVRVRHLGASTWTRLPRRRRQWLRARATWLYARRNLGRATAVSIAAATIPALAIGAALDVAHYLARRP